MQIQSNILDTSIIKPETTETTALGAAYLAGLGIGFWKDIPEIREKWKIKKSFSPGADASREEMLKGWRRAVNATISWSKNADTKNRKL